MFVTAKKHQEVISENNRLRKYNEELIARNETIADDLNRKHARELAQKDYGFQSFKQDMELAHKKDLLEKDNEIKKIANELERTKSESEARLALAEDIHQDEIIALEEKYEAKEKALEIEYQAKKSALEDADEADSKYNEAAGQEIRARAEREGTEIIQKALENVQVIYRNALDLLVSRLKEVPTMSPAEITALIKASTENYPALPETLTSTSSSK